jgi:hypothetical protein
MPLFELEINAILIAPDQVSTVVKTNYKHIIFLETSKKEYANGFFILARQW